MSRSARWGPAFVWIVVGWILIGWRLTGGLAAQASDDDLRVRAATGTDDAERCRALAELQDRGVLGTAELMLALGAERSALPDTAVAILRHQWLVWPDALLRGLDGHPGARLAVLRELAQAPRPVVDAWVAGIAAQADGAREQRLLALAARLATPGRDEARFIVESLLDGAGNEAVWAAARIAPEVADRLVSTMHGMLQGNEAAERLWPFFERLSPQGLGQLLGIAATLDSTAARALYAQLAQRAVPAYFERVRAALDGEIPLDDEWLLRAGPLLTTPARQDRVAAVLGDASRAEAVRLRAFDALVEAGVYVGAMREFAAGDGERLLRLLAAGVALPEEVQLAALDDHGAQRVGIVRRFADRPLTPLLQERLVEALGEASADHPHPNPLVAVAAAQALAVRGDDVGVAAALQAVRADSDQARQLYDLLGRRRDPIADLALRAELAEPMRELQTEVREVLRDQLRLVLAERGDRRQLAELLRTAPDRDPAFVRRCRHAVPDLRPEHVAALFARLDGVADVDVRIELLLWLEGAELPALRADLQRRWLTAEDEEEREVALRTLLNGPERDDILRRWRAGDVDEELQDLVAYGAIAAMPDELRERDVALLRELLFDLPRRDARRERERAAQFPDGRTGFPVVAAIADRLRRSGPAAAAVCAVARELATAGDTKGLSRQRLLFLWSALQADPALRQAVARETAALVLAIADPGRAGEGAANYYLALDLRDRGEHAAAATAFATALRYLLRLPDDKMHARIHLGMRDPDAGVDPYAALAAAPHLELAAAAVAAGDPAAARSAAGAAAEFAGRDRATRAAIAAILASLP